MHATDTPSATFIHNRDFSGEVRIVVERSQANPVPGPDREMVEVTVEFNDIKELVGRYIMRRRISELGMLTGEEMVERFTA